MGTFKQNKYLKIFLNNILNTDKQTKFIVDTCSIKADYAEAVDLYEWCLTNVNDPDKFLYDLQTEFEKGIHRLISFDSFIEVFEACYYADNPDAFKTFYTSGIIDVFRNPAGVVENHLDNYTSNLDSCLYNYLIDNALDIYLYLLEDIGYYEFDNRVIVTYH